MKILAHAQELIYQLLDLMPSPYQRKSLKAILELFLRAQGWGMVNLSLGVAPQTRLQNRT